MGKISLFLLLIFCCLSSMAQDESTIRRYRAEPMWISMLKDSSPNYFEVVRAFDLFWEGKRMPVQEDEILGEKYSIEQKRKGIFVFLFGPKEESYEHLAFEVKRFRNWQRRVLPLVQPDGRILSREEELEIWKNQKPQ